MLWRKTLNSRFTSLWLCLACQHRISYCLMKNNKAVSLLHCDWLFPLFAREASSGNRSNSKYKSTRERVDSKGLPAREGGGYFRNSWVGMCRWDPGTLSLQNKSDLIFSYFWVAIPGENHTLHNGTYLITGDIGSGSQAPGSRAG